MRRTTTAVVFIFLAAGLVPEVVAQPARKVGSQFQVDTFTTAYGVSPAIASDAAGNFVVVWVAGSGSYGGIMGRRFDSAGNPIDPTEFMVSNFTTTAFPLLPDVAMNDAGEFVAVWHHNIMGYATDIRGRLFDSSGTPVTSEFQVNSFTTSTYSYLQLFGLPRVAMDDAGAFRVVWFSEYDSNYLILGREFDSSGTAVSGSEFLINTYTTTAAISSDIAMEGDGDFIVVWTGSAPAGTGILGRRFDSSGASRDPVEFVVSAGTTAGGYFPTVDLDASGNFVVAWEYFDPGSIRILGRRFDSSGSPLDAGNFQVRSEATANPNFISVLNGMPNLDVNASGDFVISWASTGYEPDVFARRFGSSGTSVDPSGFVVNGHTTDQQNLPGVLLEDSGDFVVVWGGAGPTDGYAVWGQKLDSGSCGFSDLDGDALGDHCDIVITMPLSGDTLDCRTPGDAATRPVLTWTRGRYDRFRAMISWSPTFNKGERITSGRTLLERSRWKPGRRAWRRACDNANPGLYIRVFGKDLDLGTKRPRRRTLSNELAVDVVN